MRTISRVCLLAPVLYMVLAGSLSAQTQLNAAWNEAGRDVDNVKSLPMHSSLFNLCKLAETTEVHVRSKREAVVQSLRPEVEKYRLEMDDQGLIEVEIVGPPTESLDEAMLKSFGSKLVLTWQNYNIVHVPIENLIYLAQALPAGYELREPNRPEPQATGQEGATNMNVMAYRNNTADGAGKTIAIMDLGFNRLTNAIAANDTPPLGAMNICAYDAGSPLSCGLTPAQVAFTTRHGVGCLEAAYDNAPGANYILYMMDTVASFGLIVGDIFSNRNVDIISHSVVWFNQGWNDDDGPINALTTQLANSNILFLTAAGNYAEDHWQGTFNSGPDFDNTHDWVNGDETWNFHIPSNRQITLSMQWNTNTGPHDYDIFILTSNLATVLASSTSGAGIYENVTYQNTNVFDQYVAVQVTRVSGSIVPFEVVIRGFVTNHEYLVETSSVVAPANNTHPRVIAVGAVSISNYTQGAAGTNVAFYSSRGPSNSGMQLPDVAGPTDTSTTAYINTNSNPSGRFDGTSCATPNVAGALAAFWSSAANFSADGINYLLREKAEIFKDWGVAGMDNTFGRGGISLHDYHTNTVWIDSNVTNATGTPTYPFELATHATSNMTSGGRTVYLGGSYPEPVTFDMEQRHETIRPTAVVGD